MALPYGENFIILTSAVFYDPPTRLTDGQAGGRAIIAYTRCSILSRVKTGVTIHRTGPVAGRKLLIISLWRRIKMRKTS